MKRGIKIIFFGTPLFAKIILEQLIESNYKPVLVVTTSDKPVGRKQILTPPPIKVLAKKYDIPVSQPKTLANYKLKYKPDLIIVAAYGKVIPKKILEIPKYGALNVHPSLLPRWRGPSPIQYAILNGDKETGVTIMLMDEKLDHGPIVSSEKLKMKNEKFTAEELSNKLAALGANLLIKTIPKWIAGKIKSKEQDRERATYSKIITKEAGRIDWSKSAKEIERQIRAFTPWPGSFTFWNDIRIKITKGLVVKNPNPEHNTSRKVYPATNGGFCVATGDGVLFIEKLQPEGKNEITSKQFLNGHPEIIGAIL